MQGSRPRIRSLIGYLPVRLPTNPVSPSYRFVLDALEFRITTSCPLDAVSCVKGLALTVSGPSQRSLHVFKFT